jgi:type IV secretory pathway TrbF-like protein
MTVKVPENPYEAAKGVWNERYRRFVTEKRNWQILAALALVANATQAGGMAWLASQSRVVPYIVRVDEAGRSLVIGPAAEAAHADARVIAWQLQDYLQRARQVTPDRTVQKALLERVYSTTRGPATAYLNEHYRGENPFVVAERTTVEVAVESLLQVSSDTWQLDWVEHRRSLDGQTVGEERWTGQLTVEIDPPRTADLLLMNPLGFYVNHITWSRRL